jgi:hypothetical protein
VDAFGTVFARKMQILNYPAYQVYMRKIAD